MTAIINLVASDTSALKRKSFNHPGGVTVANNAAYKMLDGTIMQQSALQSYLDAFLLISVFFIATSPFLLLTQNKKVSAETMKKVAEESH